MSSSDRLDVIIFGASGFTGKYTVFQAIEVLKDLKWGVAGRNKEKLEQVLKEMGAKAKIDLSKTPIIVADIKDEESLKKMTAQAKIIVNCCGPYRHFGEQVIKACVASSTHHVDVSGEPQYMEQMQLQYNDAAKEKGIYIVSACGFDSIPADMGVIFLQEKFGGVVNSVETYVGSYFKDDYKPSGAGIHYGTWESAVYGLAHANELRGIRSQLFKTRLPKMEPKLEDRPVMHKSDLVRNRWCLPFPGSDRSVVMRSQRRFFEIDNKRPVQMRAYIAFDSIGQVLGVMMVGAILALLSKFEFGRKMLLAHPKAFTFGFVSHEGPTEESMEHTVFEMMFSGEGWKETLAEPTDKYDTPMNKKIITKVTGTNPGYGATCVALLLAATTILKDNSKMPNTGGVFPPGAAFKNTNLISDLCKNGFTFDVISIE
ncbi:unnamed protein product [Diamesa tonsa]